MTEALVKIDKIDCLQEAANRPAPRDVIHQATEEANVLAEVIEGQKLYSMIQGKKFVKVEGWVTLATLRGCLPREVSVTEMPEGRYVAEVELVRMSDGIVLTKASAECGGPEDPVWQKRPPNARRSMAITRATGKSARVAFSWVMALSGFEVTPLEEMPETLEGETYRPKLEPKPVAKPVATPAPPSGVLRFVGTVCDYNEKQMSTGLKTGIRLKDGDGIVSDWLGTWDTKIAAEAKRLHDGGDLCEAWYVTDKNPRYFVLTDISAVVFEP